MTSPLPPKRRDSRGWQDLIRQDRTRLAQLDRGLVGGKFPAARPVKPRFDIDDDEDFDDEPLEIAFCNTDRATASAAGQIVLGLTYEPIPGSLHVRWNGLDQPPTDWSLAGQRVTFTAPHVHVGHVLTAAYAYYPSDIPDPVITSPADGSTTTGTTPTITGTAPAGSTVEVFIDDVSMGTTSAADGTWSLTTSVLSDGGHTAGATSTNPDDSTGVAEPVSFSIVSPTPATATLRNTATASSSNSSGSPSIASFALPSSTQVWDLITLAATGDVSVTDSRLTNVGGGLWVGFATTLDPIALTATSGFAKFWAITCATLSTNATTWTSAVVTTDSALVDGERLAVGQVASVGAAICGIVDNHHTVAGRTDLPTGYTVGAESSSGIVHSRVDFWTSGTLATSPAGSSYFSGGDGGATAVVIGLIGP